MLYLYLGFGLRTHVSILCLWSFVRFSGPLLLRWPAGSPGRPWVSVCGLPDFLSGRCGQVLYRVRVAACGALEIRCIH